MGDQYYNNYLKYGWGDNIYGNRTNKKEKFWFKFGKCTQPPMDFRSECLRAADLIYQSTDKEIVVHFSGGIDSEIICISFLLLRHPFKVHICRFSHDLNKHDIDYAVKFCKKHNIEYSFTELDIKSYFESDCLHYRKVEFPNPYWAKNEQKFLMDNGGSGFQIIGEGDLFLSHDLLNLKKQSYKNCFHFPGSPIRPRCWNTARRLDDDIYLMVYEPYFQVSSHMEENNIDGCCLFYAYTPELIASYLQDDFVIDWLTYCELTDLSTNRLYPYAGKMLTADEYRSNGHFGGGNSIMRFKKNLKFKHFPEMEDRPKYTGLEHLQPEIIKYTDYISEKHLFDTPGNNVVTIPYTQLLKDLNI